MSSGRLWVPSGIRRRPASAMYRQVFLVSSHRSLTGLPDRLVLRSLDVGGVELAVSALSRRERLLPPPGRSAIVASLSPRLATRTTFAELCPSGEHDFASAGTARGPPPHVVTRSFYHASRHICTSLLHMYISFFFSTHSRRPISPHL